MVSCVEDFNHKEINTEIINPDISQKTEITFKELYHLHSNEIGKDTVITGYVVSSDQQGNFYREIFVQNTLGDSDISVENPRMGIKIRVGVNSTSTKFAKGRKVVVDLSGLKRTTSDDLITVGVSSGNYIKDVLEFDIDHHILKMDEVGTIIPKTIELSQLTDQELNTLIKIEDVHFKESDLGLPFAGLPSDDYDGLRTLVYCDNKRKDSIFLETSNFADFSDEILPEKQMDITAIYHISYDDEPILILNKIEDLQEVGDYITCPEITTTNLMITEVADPKVGTGEVARYVEIYNPTPDTISLDGWSLKRYNKTTSNNNAYVIHLDGLVIEGNSTVIIANNDVDETTNKTWFEIYFGFAPAMTNSNLNGNGDDAYELIDPLNKMKDVFGIPNVDGTDTVWEYENGVAVRKSSILVPYSIFDETEWMIKTELPELSTGGSSDFTPGVR